MDAAGAAGKVRSRRVRSRDSCEDPASSCISVAKKLRREDCEVASAALIAAPRVVASDCILDRHQHALSFPGGIGTDHERRQSLSYSKLVARPIHGDMKPMYIVTPLQSTISLCTTCESSAMPPPSRMMQDAISSDDHSKIQPKVKPGIGWRWPTTPSAYQSRIGDTRTFKSWFAIAIALTVLCYRAMLPGSGLIENGSICVSGGGFSGFWFTLGRLYSVRDLSSKHYYCYSAGCLGVVAVLSEYSMEEMWDMAHGVQNRWKSGEISRYEVVPSFVDNLLDYSVKPVDGNHSASLLEPDDFARLNILTTVADGWFGVKTSIRTPTSLENLRTMLIQSAWIPFAVGDDLWHDEHMDGAFSIQYHPSCEHHLGLAFDMDLMANVINVNLGWTKAEKLWNKGLAYGL